MSETHNETLIALLDDIATGLAEDHTDREPDSDEFATLQGSIFLAGYNLMTAGETDAIEIAKAVLELMVRYEHSPGH